MRGDPARMLDADRIQLILIVEELALISTRAPGDIAERLEIVARVLKQLLELEGIGGSGG